MVLDLMDKGGSLVTILNEEEIKLFTKCKMLSHYKPFIEKVKSRLGASFSNGKLIIFLGGLEIILDDKFEIEGINICSLIDQGKRSRIRLETLTDEFDSYMKVGAVKSFNVYGMQVLACPIMGVLIIADGDVIKTAYEVKDILKGVREENGLIEIRVGLNYCYLDKDELNIVDVI